MPDERATIFIDRNSGGKTLRAELSHAGLKIVLHDDLFDQNTPDEVWLEAVAKLGYVVVTGDKRVAKDVLFLAKLEKFPAWVFILLGLNHGGPQNRSKCIIDSSPLFQELTSKCARTAIWRISKDCKSTVKCDHKATLLRLRIKSKK